LLGAPGSGKGTQALLLSRHFSIPKISTGDIFRNILKTKSTLADTIRGYMETGGLVPDAIVIELIRGVMRTEAKDGFVFDGFPRTVEQAVAFDQLLCDENKKLNYAIDLHMDDAVLLKRLLGRYTCEHCGSQFHVEFKPPKVDKICDSCGSNLIVRDDDTEDKIRNRMIVYKKNYDRLSSFYRTMGILIAIDGDGAIDCINDKIKQLLCSV